jgi:hypothetical protein
MKAYAKRRRPNAVLGFLKAFGMVFVLLFMLPVWLIRGVRSRARFRAELRASGVPAEAARRLSGRLKIRLRDLRGFSPAMH